MNKVLKNFLYNSGYQVLMIIIPIITTPYLTRTLGKDAIGINSYTNSVILLFSTFGLLGLTNYSNREIAYSNTKGKEELSKTFISLCLIRGILLCVSLFVYCLMMYFSEYKIYFALQLFALLYNFIDISWFFVGIENMKIVVLRNSIVKIISTILIFLFVKRSNDLGIYIVINGGGMLLGACIVFPQVRKYIQWVQIGREDVTRHILPIIKLFLPQAASSMYVLFDKTMIKWLTGNVESVGFYDQSQSIAKVPLVLAGSLATVMLPRISNEYSKGNMGQVKKYLEKSFDFIVIMAYPVLFGLIGTASTLVHWYLGKQFLPCISLLQLLSVIVLPIFLTYVTGVMYLMALDKTRELTISYTIAAILNLSVNAALIPKFGAYGAALGTICAEFAVLIIQYYYMKKEMGNMHLLRKSIKSILSSIVMFFIVWYIGIALGNGIKVTIIQIFAGAIIYCVFMCLLRTDIIIEFLKCFHNMFLKNRDLERKDYEKMER